MKKIILCLCLTLLMVSCTYSPYARPRVVWEKDISKSSKPSVKITVETGVDIR